MPDITVTGHGTCSKCGHTTEIRRIESTPFPEETNVETAEVCDNCRNYKETGFYSSNAMTTFLHQQEKELQENRDRGQ